MRGRTWRKVPEDSARKIENLLLKEGEKIQTKNPIELWRIVVKRAIYILYKSGTLYRTPSEDEEVLKLDKKIDAILGKEDWHGFEYFVGLDETGKGEVFGNIVLVGVLIPKYLKTTLYQIIGSADTKNIHTYKYWQKIYSDIVKLEREGLKYIVKEIYPAIIDKYNLNQLMDIFYSKIIINLIKNFKTKRIRIVIDDYGVGKFLKDILSRINSKVITEKHSEERFLETKLASIIAKKIQMERVINIFSKKDYYIEKIGIPSGNLGDERTIKWLNMWYEKHGEFPWFVRKSYKTIRDIKKLDSKLIKDSPIKAFKYVSKNFMDKYQGSFQMNSAFIVKCSVCSGEHSIIKLSKNDSAIVFKCPLDNCGSILIGIEIPLMFYFDKVVIDENIGIETIIELIRNQSFPAGFNLYVKENILNEEFRELQKFGLIGIENIEEGANYKNKIILVDKKNADFEHSEDFQVVMDI